MHQGLVQVEHQAVLAVTRHLREVWGIGRGQRLVASDGCSTDAIKRRQVRILLELLDFFAGLDDVVANVLQAVRLNRLQSTINYYVKRPQSRTRNHRTLEKALVLHLDESLSRKVSAGARLLALSNDALEHRDDLLVELSHAHVMPTLSLLARRW